MDKPVNSVDNIVKIVDNSAIVVDESGNLCGKNVGTHTLKHKEIYEKTETTSSYELWIRW